MCKAQRVQIGVLHHEPQWHRLARQFAHRAAALPRNGACDLIADKLAALIHPIAGHRSSVLELDPDAPGSDGMALMKDILAIDEVPLIFLSAYGRDEVIASAFDMGAADYVVKPFSQMELAARIRAALREYAEPELQQPSEPFVMGDLTIDYSQRRATLAGRPVELTAIEYLILVKLSGNAGRVLTHDHLLRRVWGQNHQGDSGPVRNIVKRLRRKLGDDAQRPTYILTVPLVGYRMPKGETEEGTPT